MQTIGLIGGMSWESTLSYYKALNEGIKQALGGMHSAKIVLNSVDFAEIEALQHRGCWDEAGELLSKAAQSVEAGGADFLLICTNTMHKVAAQVEASVSIPLVHIADATAEQLINDGIRRVGLLGTAFTMEQDFYKGRLQDKFGIDVIAPDEQQRALVHRVSYEELCQGQIQPESRSHYLQIIDALHQQGADAVILGCTEIALLVNASDTDVPLYDTTAIHSEAAIRYALRESRE